MFGPTRLAMAGALLLVLGIRVVAADKPDDKSYVDKEYGFKVVPPEKWEALPREGYRVPGELRAVWSPGKSTSITAFVQQNKAHVTAKALLESNVASCKQAGFDVQTDKVGKVAGLDAMSLVFIADGTGGAIVPGGEVRTAQHWVAIPRGEEILVFLLTTPQADLEKHEPAFKSMMRGLEVDKERPVAAASSAPGLKEIKRCGFEKDTPGELPEGWARWGEDDAPYRVAVADGVGHDSRRSCRVERRGTGPDEDSFAGCGTSVSAEEWLGKRVRLTAFIRTEKVTGAAFLVLRVDGESGSLAFDNMQMNGRELTGTTDWKKCALVLDVAKEAKRIVFGLCLSGAGTMWVDDMLLEVVGPEVPRTDGGGKAMAAPPGLMEARGEYTVRATSESTDAKPEGVTLLMPVPLSYREQVPLAYELSVEPASDLRRVRVFEDRPGNLVAEVQLAKPGEDQKVGVKWRAIVLCGPRTYDDVPAKAELPDTWPEEARPWLKSTRCVQAEHERIQAVAQEIRGQTRDVREIIRGTLARTGKIFRAQTGSCYELDAVGALEKRGSCTSCANLVAALLRAQDIPARVLAGYPTNGSALQTHYIVEAYVPTYGWYPIESTELVAPWSPERQVEVAIVPPEYEDRSEVRPVAAGGVPYLSLTECPGQPRDVLVLGAVDAERNCDHVARGWQALEDDGDAAAWKHALDAARARWEEWAGATMKDGVAVRAGGELKEALVLRGPLGESALAGITSVRQLIVRLQDKSH